MTSDAAGGLGGARFVGLTVTATAAAVAVLAAVNWRINSYALFGNARGASRTVIANERQTKYLFSFNYIPANFDALLVGSSLASNIDTSKVNGVSMYNAALSGGNISEEKLIAENALRRGHFKFLITCLNPYLLRSHGRKAGGMNPGDVWTAFGSTDLLSTYIGALAIGRGWVHQRFSAEGAQDLSEFQRPAGNIEAVPKAAVVPQEAAPEDIALALDEKTAWAELAELAALARTRGAAVVWVFLPVYLPTYRAHYRTYANFEARIRAVAKPGELIINFNDGSFAPLSEEPKTFFDGVHLSEDGALAVARTLDRVLAANSEAAVPPR